MKQMKPRINIAIVTIGAMIASATGGVIAFQMLLVANANEPVPAFVPPLIVVALLTTVALLAWAAALQKKLPSRRQ
ncbi:hypothetical protein [Microbacterium rhizomatis]|uniref:Uncharacterized protein n=1 Tax=Microbacterium rhizomatis TaxID=1631477 RepID=A0A5J5J1B3_9MICO|nr:hypothetical protein [Microbacterium rhizomatis]KAA9106340.1 hypothetical protein F6B43_14365 [Microbacterium rhizomatis]